MRVTKADKWLIAILLLLSASGIGMHIGWFSRSAGSGAVAEITVNGQHFKTIPLREGYREELRIGGNEHYNIIEVENNRIRVRDADCPDQVCVRTGWVSMVPQQIVCLPYRVVIKVVSSAPSDVDDIAR